MKRIQTLKKNTKIPTMQKSVPKTEQTILQEKINQLLPNDLHNLENPSIYLKIRQKNAKCEKKKIKEFFLHPLFREYKKKIYTDLLRDPNFISKTDQDLTITNYKNYINELFFKIIKSLRYTPEDFIANPNFYIYLALIATLINPSLATKVGVQYGLYYGTLKKLGTEKHQIFGKKALMLQDLGCFMMTEMAHGSNVQGILTTATYLHEERVFILNTPHELGMKFWIGNLARTANYGVVFANLVIGEQSYGIHVFLVEIRDDKGELVRGLTVGDCGPKLGMNGVDNGWAVFRRVKIPYDNLLDKYSQIDINGNFVSKIKKKTTRFALQLSALSSGRLMVAMTSIGTILCASGITTRYLCVRKQFGSKKYKENTLLTYPSVQNKLIPYISRALIFMNFTDTLNQKFSIKNMSNIKDLEVKRLHALCSYIKTACSWDSLQVMLNTRELCGGHGYSSYSKLPLLLRDQNVQITWEGTNDVLIQQTGKFLLHNFMGYIKTKKIEDSSLFFLKNFENEEKMKKEIESIIEIIEDFNLEEGDIKLFLSVIKKLMELRLKIMIKIVIERFSNSLQDFKNGFKAFNNTLPDCLLDCCKFYGEYMAFLNYEKEIITILNPKYENEKNFAVLMFFIFALDSIKQKGFYFTEILNLEIFKKFDILLLELYPKVLNDLIVMFDAFLPPDVVLNSTLGNSNADPYQNIVDRIYSDSKNFGKSENWEDIMKVRNSI